MRKRRSRASGLTRPLAAAIRGVLILPSGVDFVVGPLAPFRRGMVYSLLGYSAFLVGT